MLCVFAVVFLLRVRLVVFAVCCVFVLFVHVAFALYCSFCNCLLLCLLGFVFRVFDTCSGGGVLIDLALKAILRII